MTNGTDPRTTPSHPLGTRNHRLRDRGDVSGRRGGERGLHRAEVHRYDAGVRQPSTTTTLTATITNSGQYGRSEIGSIFLDSPEANFGAITPASAFVITDPTNGVVRTDWTGKLESAYGSGGDRYDLDGLYLVANYTARQPRPRAPGSRLRSP